ncbi:hypothetical protein AC626_01280 [Pseudoalteromonas rubra]|uniref:Uncharacterized protein n=1 Tax=Pseudoalteromonas rubra TaxID=43658 RepID=A0A0L0EXF2_9GAMM|nr:hypothetical protein AC626_01280 [Pseudoalteromonas rubra]
MCAGGDYLIEIVLISNITGGETVCLFMIDDECVELKHIGLFHISNQLYKCSVVETKRFKGHLK